VSTEDSSIVEFLIRRLIRDNVILHVHDLSISKYNIVYNFLVYMSIFFMQYSFIFSVSNKKMTHTKYAINYYAPENILIQLLYF